MEKQRGPQRGLTDLLGCFAPVRHRVDVDGYEDFGDLSSVDPQYRRLMSCDKCMVRWYGCLDAFQCPKCGEGELPCSYS